MNIQTTVVFTDLIGSTRVFEVLGNVKATEIVTQLTRWIEEVFTSHGGRVIKTLGDGVLAVFPDGQAVIDAVVEVQREHQNRMAQMPEALRMPIRIGIASGDIEIVSGDCYGDAVNIASRLSDLSGPHEIWANGPALQHARESDGIRFRILGPINIRGRAEPCAVYQVEWKEDETNDSLTIQADHVPAVAQVDALGGQIELCWRDTKKVFRSFELPIHIGRIRHAEFVVSDPRVSRTHARIDWRNGSVVLTDISTYGTWVRFSGGGADLQLRREECVLHGRGEIAMGASFADQNVPTVAFSVS